MSAPNNTPEARLVKDVIHCRNSLSSSLIQIDIASEAKKEVIVTLRITKELWVGGIFRFRITFPKDYPSTTLPDIVLLDQIFHPFMTSDSRLTMGEIGVKTSYFSVYSICHQLHSAFIGVLPRCRTTGGMGSGNLLALELAKSDTSNFQKLVIQSLRGEDVLGEKFKPNMGVTNCKLKETLTTLTPLNDDVVNIVLDYFNRDWLHVFVGDRPCQWCRANQPVAANVAGAVGAGAANNRAPGSPATLPPIGSARTPNQPIRAGGNGGGLPSPPPYSSGVGVGVGGAGGAYVAANDLPANRAAAQAHAGPAANMHQLRHRGGAGRHGSSSGGGGGHLPPVYGDEYGVPGLAVIDDPFDDLPGGGGGGVSGDYYRRDWDEYDQRGML